MVRIFSCLGSAGWEEFVRESELKTIKSCLSYQTQNIKELTFTCMNLYLFPDKSRSYKYEKNESLKASPASPAPTRPPRHLPSGGKKQWGDTSRVELGCFLHIWRATSFFLVSFRFRPNCANVSLTTHSNTLCPSPLPSSTNQLLQSLKAQLSNRVNFWGW